MLQWVPGRSASFHNADPMPGPPWEVRNVNYTMFEADRIPAAWARCAFAHDLIVLPVEPAYRAWAASGVPEDRLRICPLGVNPQHFWDPVEPPPLTMPDGRPLKSIRSRFLNVAEMRPRKNHLGLLRTWMKSTHRDDDACLILKTSAFQPGAFAKFQADVHEMQRRAGRALSDAAPVLILSNQVTGEQMRSLYASATHYVSMSHGESWDLPMMEAAVSGLSLIAPRHTAYLTYLRENEADFIPAPLVPAAFEGKTGAEDWIFFEGCQWWKPDEDAAVEIIRRIIGGSAEPKQSPRVRIAAEYTWEKAASRLLELIF